MFIAAIMTVTAVPTARAEFPMKKEQLAEKLGCKPPATEFGAGGRRRSRAEHEDASLVLIEEKDRLVEACIQFDTPEGDAWMKKVLPLALKLVKTTCPSLTQSDPIVTAGLKELAANREHGVVLETAKMRVYIRKADHNEGDVGVVCVVVKP